MKTIFLLMISFASASEITGSKNGLSVEYKKTALSDEKQADVALAECKNALNSSEKELKTKGFRIHSSQSCKKTEAAGKQWDVNGSFQYTHALILNKQAQ